MLLSLSVSVRGFSVPEKGGTVSPVPVGIIDVALLDSENSVGADTDRALMGPDRK